MPSVLYKVGDSHTVYRMSEVFVPPKDPNDPHRVNMIRYNQKIMSTELAKKLPLEKASQRRERRRDRPQLGWDRTRWRDLARLLYVFFFTQVSDFSRNHHKIV